MQSTAPVEGGNAQGQFDPDLCDLCGATELDVLVELKTGRALRSDRTIVASSLRKLACRRCGLARDGHAHHAQHLADVYGQDYSPAPADYTFYTPAGPLKRSMAFCDWLVGAFGEHRWRSVRRCLEIGAGAGALLECFARRFPETRFEGVELSEAQLALARSRGLDVRQSSVEQAREGVYDAIYSVAVLEHVPSPYQLLREIRRRLKPGGLLFLSQPTQEIPSYDVFFVDHLHHFAADHVEHYARSCGFRSLGYVVGHEWMPNFSAHLWQAVEPIPARASAWSGSPRWTTCAETVRQVSADMRQLDATLAGLARGGRRVAVFGLNEVYALARAYSELGAFPLCCGLDDKPEALRSSELGFPVVLPEQCRELGVQDVILAVNKVYHSQLYRRLAPLGVTVHPVLN